MNSTDHATQAVAETTGTAAGDTSDSLLVPPPSSTARRWIGVGIALFLVSQLLIPAVYYFRGELTTERFAWRMFSSVHMSDWKCQVFETVRDGDRNVERPVPLDAVLQESTVKCLHAGQLDVVEPFLLKWLSRDGVQRVEYYAQGTWPSGRTTDPIHIVGDAETGQLERIVDDRVRGPRG